MSDIVKLGGKIVLGKLLGNAIQIFASTGVPQRIAIQIFTDLLSDSLSNLLKGDGGNSYTFSEDFLGVFTFPGVKQELPVDAYAVKVSITDSRIVRFGYDTVTNGVEGGSYAFGSGESWVEEGSLNVAEQLLLIPEFDMARNIQIDYMQLYIEYGVSVSCSVLKRTAS
jgi:hypothetical protein